MRDLTKQEYRKNGCKYCIDGRKKRGGTKKRCIYDSCPYERFIRPYGNYEKFARSPNAFMEVCKILSKEHERRANDGLE